MPVNRTCQHCGAAFLARPYLVVAGTAKYCSNSCSGAARSILQTKPPAVRFWPKVNKNGPVPEYRPDLGPCWIWLGGRYRLGYGMFGVRAGSTVSAHRWAYEQAKGAIPDGLPLDHLCRVPLCVNPDHLEPVTQRENVLRGIGRASSRAKQTHCLRGHPFDQVNTTISKNGTRHCKKCDAFRKRKAWRETDRASVNVVRQLQLEELA